MCITTDTGGNLFIYPSRKKKKNNVMCMTTNSGDYLYTYKKKKIKGDVCHRT